MKIFARILLVLNLTLALSGILGISTVLADEPEKPKCELRSEGGDAIPSTFSVGDCLVAPGQEESKFVPDKEGQVPNPSGGMQVRENKKTVASFLVEAINLLVKIIASLALIIFIVGALLTVTSEGKEDRLEKGKTAMFYAIIGLIVAFFSFIIVTFVQSVLF